jgi:hypothetical protein
LDYKLDRNLPAVLITGVDAEKTPTFDVDFIKLLKKDDLKSLLTS